MGGTGRNSAKPLKRKPDSEGGGRPKRVRNSHKLPPQKTTESSTSANEVSAATSIPATRSPASFMTLPFEIRLEILRYLLLLERNQVLKYDHEDLTDAYFIAAAKYPLALRSTYLAEHHSNLDRDHLRFHILRHRIDYQPSLQILQTCKQLKEEGEDIFYKENHYIGLHNPRPVLTKALRHHGISFRVWRNAHRLMSHPVLQIEFGSRRNRSTPGKWVWIPPSELRRLAYAFYYGRIGYARHILEIDRMRIRAFPGTRTIQIFRQRDFAGVENSVQRNLIDWIGNDVYGSLAEGWFAPNWEDRTSRRVDLLSMPVGPSEALRSRQVRFIKEDFEKAYSVHALGGLHLAVQDYLDLRVKIQLVAIHCRAVLRVPILIVAPRLEYHLLSMLSWILFHMATAAGPSKHRILFAHRALTLPTYVAETEWKVRIHVLVAGLLKPFAALWRLRVFHLIRAGSLLELAEEHPVAQQSRAVQAMAAKRTAVTRSLEESAVLLHKGLKMEAENKYGVEMVIPMDALDL